MTEGVPAVDRLLEAALERHAVNGRFVDRTPYRARGSVDCWGGETAVVEPFVPQRAAEVEFDGVRYRFVASSAARYAANAVQGEVPAEAGVASEYGHEWRYGHIPAPATARLCGMRIVS